MIPNIRTLLLPSLGILSFPPVLAAQPPPVTAGLVVRLDAGDIAGLGDGETVASWNDAAIGLVSGDGAQDASFDPSPARIGLFRMGVGDTYGEAVLRSDNRPAVQSGSTNSGGTLNFRDEGYYVGAGLIGGSGVLGEFANGRIAEILFYNRELNEAETNEVGHHLEQKYGLDTGFVPPPDGSPRPDMVIFLSDDHTWRDSSLYGSTEIETPNMERVARNGMTFDQAFVNSPTCAPARAALLTGLYPARNGAEPNHARPDADIKKLPAYLQELGYEVVSFGKVGHYAQTPEYGFDVARHFGFHENVAIPNAVEWLENRESDKPLCLFVGSNWPHVPWPEDGSEFPTGDLTVPPNQVDTPSTRGWRARYLAAVRNMDDELGMVYDAAREKFGDDFFFLHTSDHGAQWPFAKWNLYEDGTRTPFIVTWPGVIQPDTRTGAMVSWIDILPTLVEVAGGTPPAVPAQIDGRSILPVLRGESATHRELIFTTHSGDGNHNVYPIRSVRTGDGWKYIRNLHPEFLYRSHVTNFDPFWPTWMASAETDPHAAGRVLAYQQRPAEELYQVNDDPWELDNLVGDPAHAGRVAALAEALDEWMLETGDPQTVFGDPTPLPPAALPVLGTDLFVDTFNRGQSNDADARATGMHGDRVPPLGAGASYYEGFEGSGSGDSIRIVANHMQLAVGAGMSETGIMHNFIGEDIIEAGGFSVQMTVLGISNTAGGPVDRYVGFGVGLSEAEAAAGGDIAGQDSFRGSVANPIGNADFFVDLDANGDLKVWRKGQLLESVPVGATSGTIVAKFALDGFAITSTVEVTVFFDGQPVDLNPGDPDSITRGVSWDSDDTNHVGLSARASGSADIDNFAIRRLPLAEGLSVSHAIGAGLGGTDAAPGADPDGDGRSNFLEWAIGSDPGTPDSGITAVTALAVEPGQSRTRFGTRRLIDPGSAGLEYTVMLSPDLENWTPVEAAAVSPPSSIPGTPGYETIELELPPDLVAGESRLFIVIGMDTESRVTAHASLTETKTNN